MRARRLPLLLVPVLALGLSGCGVLESFLSDEPERDPDTGEIVEASDAGVMTLRVGDCLTSFAAFEGTDVMTVPTGPCAEPHEVEVFARTVLPAGSFPGVAAVQSSAEEFCMAEFGDFVGTPWEDSVLDFSSLTPSQDGWERLDDRELLCLILDPEGPVTGSLEGAAR